MQKFSPYVERVILNNVNRKIIAAGESSNDNQGFSKVVEFIIPPKLITYMNKLNAPNINTKIKGKLLFLLLL